MLLLIRMNKNRLVQNFVMRGAHFSRSKEIMERIKVKDVIGKEVRSRIPIVVLKAMLKPNVRCVIDMAGVTFISRSFADELYNLQQDYRLITFENHASGVMKMMQVVWSGRSKKRVRSTEIATTESFASIEDFSKFLLTI